MSRYILPALLISSLPLHHHTIAHCKRACFSCLSLTIYDTRPTKVDAEDPSDPFYACTLAYLHIHALISSVSPHQGDIQQHPKAQEWKIPCGVCDDAASIHVSICDDLVALFSYDDEGDQGILVIWRWTDGKRLGVGSTILSSLKYLSLWHVNYVHDMCFAAGV